MINSVTESETRAICNPGRGAPANAALPSRQMNGDSTAIAAMLRIRSICHTE